MAASTLSPWGLLCSPFPSAEIFQSVAVLSTAVWDNQVSYNLFVHSSKKQQALSSTFFCFFPFCSPGVNCQVVVSPCSPNPCENSGICQESPDSEGYACQCAPGWEGKVDGECVVLSALSSAGTEPLGHCFVWGLTLGLSTFQGKDARWILMSVSPSPAKTTLCATTSRAVTCVSVGPASLEGTVTVTLTTACQVGTITLLSLFQFFLKINLLAAVWQIMKGLLWSLAKREKTPKLQLCDVWGSQKSIMFVC